MTEKNEIPITGKDKDGNEVKVIVKRPGPEEYKNSQVAYNKTFRSALDSGALLRQRLTDHMTQQGLWNEKKQKNYENLVEQISSEEEKLKAGGIRLTRAKEVALGLRDLRGQFRDLLAERNALDANSAEGQADNARFSTLVMLCLLNPETNQQFFIDEKAYESQADQPWVVEAAGQLANMLYDLDPDYDQNLEENKFLKEFNYVDDDLKFINEDGHHVDMDGKLINQEGRYIAYRTDEGYKNQDAEQVYYVNRDGEEVNEDGEKLSLTKDNRKPFLDENDKPVKIPSAQNPDGSSEEVETKTPKRKTRATKSNKTDAKTS